jgi:hypothetical protein
MDWWIGGLMDKWIGDLVFHPVIQQSIHPQIQLCPFLPVFAIDIGARLARFPALLRKQPFNNLI